MAVKVSVIGAGPGGYAAAIRAAQLGAEVTIIEKSNLGGTCLNHGCIPSKIMKTSADLFEKLHRASEFGIDINGDVLLNISAIMARKQKIIESQRQAIAGLLKQNRITSIDGNGRIKNHGEIEVEKHGGAIQTVQFDRLIIATGSRPRELPSMPFDGERILSSDDILELQKVPESLLIIGGGVIGCEFASILSAMGSKVTIVEYLDRLLPLPSIDESCSKVLQREMKKRKIQILTKNSVKHVVTSEDKIQVATTPVLNSGEKGTKDHTHSFDKVLVCTGRNPNTSTIGIEIYNIETDPNGWIKTDDRMETNAQHIFAIGDTLGPTKIMLAHVATAEGQVAAENALGHGAIMNYTAVPNTIFTMPEIACVGLSEAQATSCGFNIETETVLFRKTGKAHVIGEIEGHAKIISTARSGQIIGIHIIGSHASDLIAEGSVLLNFKGTVHDIEKTIHAHPTLSEILHETALKILGKTLHA